MHSLHHSFRHALIFWCTVSFINFFVESSIHPCTVMLIWFLDCFIQSCIDSLIQRCINSLRFYHLFISSLFEFVLVCVGHLESILEWSENPLRLIWEPFGIHCGAVADLSGRQRMEEGSGIWLRRHEAAMCAKLCHIEIGGTDQPPRLRDLHRNRQDALRCEMHLGIHTMS